MLAIGQDEIDAAPELGKTISCYECGKIHKVKYGDEVMSDGTRKESKLFAYYTCKGRSMFLGINGKDMRRRP